MITQVVEWDNIFHVDNIKYSYHVNELQTDTDKDRNFRTHSTKNIFFSFSIFWSELLQIDSHLTTNLFKCASFMISIFQISALEWKHVCDSDMSVCLSPPLP